MIKVSTDVGSMQKNNPDHENRAVRLNSIYNYACRRQ
jgi:hypothetical protein